MSRNYASFPSRQGSADSHELAINCFVNMNLTQVTQAIGEQWHLHVFYISKGFSWFDS